VKVCLNQQPTKVQQSWSIEPQTLDGGSSGGSESFDNRSSLSPLEVFVPALGARVEERHGKTRHRIYGRGFGRFVIVTAFGRKKPDCQLNASHLHCAARCVRRKKDREQSLQASGNTRSERLPELRPTGAFEHQAAEA